MPDEQATRSVARCSEHPSNASVAVCHTCGRPLCLKCAVPVRGEVFGPECLADVLGPDQAAVPQPVPPRPRDLPGNLVGLGFACAAIASILPWTRFGVGAGWFGGWGISTLRWSSLATAAALVGFALWYVRGRARPTHLGGTRLILLVLAIAIGVGAALHMLNPPPFTHPWLGPWAAIGSAGFAVLTCSWAVARSAGGVAPRHLS